MDNIDKLEADIKSLTIQGATNIALSTLSGIRIAIESGISDLNKLQTLGERLAYARPTEPMAQNAIRYIFQEKNKETDYYLAKIEECKSLISSSKEKMAHFGASIIQNGGIYLTHCHSSTVVSMFRKAHQNGKRFSVFATETRPRFQGRITAAELLKIGIDVTLIIDDVALSIIFGRLKKIDAVFIGADLLSKNGFINKVGSLGLSVAAEKTSTPLYSLSVLLKYDPRPFTPSIIEHRSGDEIWPDAPKKMHFYAPAFDYIPYTDNISIICEVGLQKGSSIANQAYETYPFLNK